MSSFVNLMDIVYPVGTVFHSFSNVSPATRFGGTWEQITDKFLYGSTSSGDTGGENTHTLTINEMPSHNHNSGSFYQVYYASTSDYDHTSSWDNRHNSSSFDTSYTGGGNLTTICQLILPVIFGGERLNLKAGGML
jgi:hypothetical protein